MSALDTLLALAPQLTEGMKQGPGHVMVCCPLHNEKTPSCSISTWKPTFFCHGCKQGGHIAQLLRMYGMSSRQIDAIIPRDSTYQKKDQVVAQRMVMGLNPFKGKYVLDEELLDAYRMMPTSLKNAGFKMETLRHFEVGYDAANLRITYPLRSVWGELVGISGRSIVEGIEPRYRIYDYELRKRTEFNVPADYSMEEAKSSILWHAHIVRPLFFLNNSGRDDMVVTEGFKACMWTWQAGHEDTVALVGSYCTHQHAELLACATRKVTLFLDNNEAGIRGTHYAGKLLLKKGIDVSVARYPDEREQPDNLSREEVHDAVVHKESFMDWSARHRMPEDLRAVRKKRKID